MLVCYCENCILWQTISVYPCDIHGSKIVREWLPIIDYIFSFSLFKLVWTQIVKSVIILLFYRL